MKNYSPLIEGLKAAFESHAANGARYMFAYWQGWGEQTACIPVASGQYPWATHDRYMADDGNASILAIGFDLQKPFETQIPDHLSQAETLQCFTFRPVLHIPDRTGIVPAERQARETERILKPKPALKLIR